MDSDDFWFKRKLEIVQKNILENKNNHIHTNNERYKFEKIKKYKSSRLSEKLNLDKKNFFQDLILNGINYHCPLQ